MSIIGANAKLSKQINRELVLKIIYNRRPISRANIANITGLTPASISKIIDEFIDILKSCELARYTPMANVTMQQDYQKAAQSISSIDKQIS